jgi:hypothetical protein
MGVNPHAASFLVAAAASGTRFESTLTIGRQRLFVDPQTLRRACERAGRPLALGDSRRLVAQRDGYVEPFLEWLGAERVDSLDASPYEGATIVHDLNQDVPAELEQRYSAVIDSGSLEHIFDFPTAIANCMRMTRVGGHLLACAPAHGEMGQGFYQFSPEVFYRVLSPENGFRVEMILLKDIRLRSKWYAVADAREVEDRVTLTSGPPAYLYVKARRERAIEPFSQAPQQSDYRALWDAAAASPPLGAPPAAKSRRSLLPTAARAFIPEAWKERYQDACSALRDRRRGRHDPRFFREVDIRRLD